MKGRFGVDEKKAWHVSGNQFDLDSWRQTLVLRHREKGRKIAWRILAAWGCRLAKDELFSATDLALCEAAQNYNPSKGASFITYAYLFIKGCLARAIYNQRNAQAALCRHNPDGCDDDCTQEVEAFLNAEDESEGIGQVENTQICKLVLGVLSNLESQVIIRSYVKEEKMASIANSMEISRSYLFEVRSRALNKARSLVKDLNLQ